MRKLLYTTALALCLGGTAQAAGVETYSQTGTWYSGAGINDHGYPQCVAIEGGAIYGSVGTVALKYDLHFASTVGVEISKQNWRIPKGTRVRVQLQVDNATPRIYWAYGDNDRVVISLNFDDHDAATGEPAIRLLMNLMSSGVQLKIWFPDGSEGPWVAQLNGSAAEVANFKGCVSSVLAKAAARERQMPPSQPFGGEQQPASTQPYTPL